MLVCPLCGSVEFENVDFLNFRCSTCGSIVSAPNWLEVSSDECILCGKVVDTGKILAPAGWRMYHDIWICEECSPKLGEKLDLLEFLRDLNSAKSALTFASRYNIPKDVKDKIEGLI